ncbi:hypothetical protein EJ05DRAFT_450418 [Pseudovirgaria hyperparasitica]|uniref:Exocyst complex protein EXO70 n=1 Tax=Pseudovirgaria hyperparasitica TaxID=470096 RepID=A0A6A6WGB4_9PEZI|nr:uncharacterized protein EJ05DRAFT_450418 [Pseudovirgaria hyperparasitica]KAF2760667.1 hypothetical protein EJ05DRAFT_450418 [Pseudovirgaria hyperparasitica]
MVAPRKAAFAEESAEVEVLFANMDKLKSLTKKIQGSVNRLETSGKSVQDAIAPIYSNTQKLQIANTNIDRMITAIDRVREPLNQRGREDQVIKAGPRKVGMQDYIASLDRTTQALAGLRQSNLKSNQNAMAELTSLIKMGTKQLEDVFRDMLREDARPLEPLQYITKDKSFPTLPEDKSSQFRIIHSHTAASYAQTSSRDIRDTPTIKVYSEIRGEYITICLRNLAAASISTARKVTADSVYKKGDNGIGHYAKALEGLFIAEYESICPVFSREEWGIVFTATSQNALNEFTKTLQTLNTHVINNLNTDCFLGYEIIEIVSNLSIRLESRTGELKRPIADSLKPVRETSKSSLGKLLDDTRNRIQSLVALSADCSTVPVTIETMTRLQNMTSYLPALTSIMTSLGDGGWNSSATASSNSIPTMKSFDVGADGQQLFAHYALDTIDTLLSNLENKCRVLIKGKHLQGIFIANNVSIIDRAIRSSELSSLLTAVGPKLDSWKKKSENQYKDSWQDIMKILMSDTIYTNRGGRPHSGSVSGAGVDSTTVVKSLSSKDKDAIKEKFRSFNNSFDGFLVQHRALKMEADVRASITRTLQETIEPLYSRFWDRYHEIDKGKGKYVKYDKPALASALKT